MGIGTNLRRGEKLPKTSPDRIANPAALGLAGFGFSAVLLSVVNAGFASKGLETSLVMIMAFFFGGLCQLIAGQWAFKLNEIFPATAFNAYGAFWEIFAFWLLLDQMGLVGEPSGTGVAWFMMLWALFSFLMWINSFYHSWNLVGVFGTLWVLFSVLGIHYIVESTLILRIGGIVGIICGFWAVWTSFTILFQEHTEIKLPGTSTPLKGA